MIDRPLRHVAGIAALAGLCVVMTACGAASTSQPAPATAPPTSVAVAPTSTALAAKVAPDAPMPTAVARPTQAPATSGAIAAPTAPASGTAMRLTLDPSSSQASYHAHEQLASKTLPSEAVGTSAGVSGTIVFGADGAVAADQSTITVDLTQLKSDESRRDNFIKSNTLEVSRFPSATFVAREVQGLPTPLPTSGQATFQLLGDLTVHGVTKPVTWQVTAQFADTTVSGDATTSVNITDFGMTTPRVGLVLSIDDALTLELAFTATRTTPT